MARDGRKSKALTRNAGGRLGAANVQDNGTYDTKTGRNIDHPRNGIRFVSVSKGDMKTASEDLRQAQSDRDAELTALKNKTRNNKGQYISKGEKQRNARNARQKQTYDIKRALGVNVG